MSVFQIGVKLLTVQRERMGVVLGRLFEPRRDEKDTFLPVENCFFPRRGAKKIKRVWGSLWAVARPCADRPHFAPIEGGSGTGTHGEATALGAVAHRPLCAAASSTSVSESRNELDGQSLRALDHAAPACPRLWTDMTGRHSVGLETVCFNIGTILAQKHARITR